MPEVDQLQQDFATKLRSVMFRPRMIANFRHRHADVELLQTAARNTDVHAKGRPPIAQVRYLLHDDRRNIFVAVRSFRYLQALAPLSMGRASVVWLPPLTDEPLRFVPIRSVAPKSVNLQHACLLRDPGVCEPMFRPTYAGHDHGVCNPSTSTATMLHGASDDDVDHVDAPIGHQGRHRIIIHAPTNRIYFINPFLRVHWNQDDHVH